VNSVDDCGYSALHLSAEHGYLDMIEVSGVRFPQSITPAQIIIIINIGFAFHEFGIAK